MTKVKICGLSTPETITVAIEEKADFIGFVFYEPSPRFVDIETASYLASFVPDSVQKVGLFVNPSMDDLETILNAVPLNTLQLHGDETPEQCAAIKEKFDLPLIKVFGIENKDDLNAIDAYKDHVDWIMLDAKPEELPGGNGAAFDWSILEGFESPLPWMLAGGLTPENVQDAIHKIKPTAVDVSSGVESEKGVKDADKIRAFIRAVKQA
ncbi:MAG: phosphoribosylanthranilate isomerase [Pseudomonadota bacterium]